MKSFNLTIPAVAATNVAITSNRTALSLAASGSLQFGDANEDNCVTAADESLLIGVFKTSACSPGACADFNNDGYVTAADESLLIPNFKAVGEGGCIP